MAITRELIQMLRQAGIDTSNMTPEQIEMAGQQVMNTPRVFGTTPPPTPPRLSASEPGPSPFTRLRATEPQGGTVTPPTPMFRPTRNAGPAAMPPTPRPVNQAGRVMPLPPQEMMRLRAQDQAGSPFTRLRASDPSGTLPPPAPPGRFNRPMPRPMPPVESMSPSQVDVARMSPRLMADPNIAPQIAEAAARRTPVTPPSTGTSVGQPRELTLRPGEGMKPRPRPTRTPQQVATQAVADTLGEEKAQELVNAPEWAMPLIVAGLSMIANNDKGVGGIGIGGLQGIQYMNDERNRKVAEARADRAESREERKVGLQERGLEAEIDNARARIGLETQRLGLEGASQRDQAAHRAWLRGFEENRLGQEMLKFRDNLALNYANLGLDVRKAQDNANYLAALSTQMGDNTTLGMLNYMLERTKSDRAHADRYAPVIADMITDIISDPNNFSLQNDEIRQKALDAVDLFYEQATGTRRVREPELE